MNSILIVAVAATLLCNAAAQLSVVQQCVPPSSASVPLAQSFHSHRNPCDDSNLPVSHNSEPQSHHHHSVIRIHLTFIYHVQQPPRPRLALSPLFPHLPSKRHSPLPSNNRGIWYHAPRRRQDLLAARNRHLQVESGIKHCVFMCASAPSAVCILQ